MPGHLRDTAEFFLTCVLAYFCLPGLLVARANHEHASVPTSSQARPCTLIIHARPQRLKTLDNWVA